MKRSNVLSALGGAALVIMGGLGATAFDMLIVTKGILVHNSVTDSSSDVGSIMIGAGMISFNDNTEESGILYYFSVVDGVFILNSDKGIVQRWAK